MTVKDFFSKPESNPIKTLVGVGAFWWLVFLY